MRLIQNGSLQFTIDQQPYLQGFYPIVQLFLAKLSGGLVAPSDTNTGLLFVTKDERQAVPDHEDPLPRELEQAQVPGLRVTIDHPRSRTPRALRAARQLRLARRRCVRAAARGEHLRRRHRPLALLLGRNEAFYSGDNAKNIAETMAPIALVAAGMAMLLICGEIDLAVGRVYALAPAIVYVVSSEEQHGLPIWVGVIAALGFSCLVGLTNGVITTFLRVPSFITTLGMLFLLNGITLHLLAGTQVFMPGGETFKKIFGSQPDEYVALLQLDVLVGLGHLSRTPVRADVDALGNAHHRDRRQHRRSCRGGRERPHDQDRQLRPRELPRRLRRASSTRPASPRSCRYRAGPTSCSSPSPAR